MGLRAIALSSRKVCLFLFCFIAGHSAVILVCRRILYAYLILGKCDRGPHSGGMFYNCLVIFLSCTVMYIFRTALGYWLDIDLKAIIGSYCIGCIDTLCAHGFPCYRYVDYVEAHGLFPGRGGESNSERRV